MRLKLNDITAEELEWAYDTAWATVECQRKQCYRGDNCEECEYHTPNIRIEEEEKLNEIAFACIEEIFFRRNIKPL